MQTYVPEDPMSRLKLAVAIDQALREQGFRIARTKKHVRETVYSRVVEGGLELRVYSTIENGHCRRVGEDAIRVCATYTSKKIRKTWGICKTSRVHRTGNIDAIVKRMLARQKKIQEAVQDPTKCEHCGAPTFVAKKGHTYCAEFCKSKRRRRRRR